MRAEGENSAFSPTRKFEALEMETPSVSSGETPIYGGSLSVEPTELHSAPSTMLADYPPVRGFQDLKNLVSLESGKLWSIAGPIAFNILCNYGINSFTSIFVGHIGDVELSAVAISLSVIANFSFGFLVRFSLFFLILKTFLLFSILVSLCPPG